MHIMSRRLLCLVLMLSSFSFGRDLTPNEESVLIRSIIKASELYRVPIPILYAVKEQEGGWPGAVIGVGDSADVGVFQINTHDDNWMPVLKKKLNVSRAELQESIAASTFGAAYILSVEYQRTGTWYEAVGNYHRHAKDSYRKSYQDSVFGKLKQFLIENPEFLKAGFKTKVEVSPVPSIRDSLAYKTAAVNFK